MISTIWATAACAAWASCCRTSSASAFTRLERVIRERMTIQDPDVVTPQSLTNIRPVTAVIKGSSSAPPRCPSSWIRTTRWQS